MCQHNYVNWYISIALSLDLGFVPTSKFLEIAKGSPSVWMDHNLIRQDSLY